MSGPPTPNPYSSPKAMMLSVYSSLLGFCALMIAIEAPGLWRLLAAVPAVAATLVMIAGIKAARQFAFGDDVPPLRTRLSVMGNVLLGSFKRSAGTDRIEDRR